MIACALLTHAVQNRNREGAVVFQPSDTSAKLYCLLELPAIPASAEITLPAAACSTAKASLRPLAALRWTSFVNHESTTHELPAVAYLNRLGGGVIVVNFDEAEPSRFAAESIAHDIYAIDLNACFGEERLKIRFSRFVRQVPNKQSRHFLSP